MTYVVYADVLFIWNFIQSLCIFLITISLLGKQIKIKKLILTTIVTALLITILDAYIYCGVTTHHLLYASIYIIMLNLWIKKRDIAVFFKILFWGLAISSGYDYLIDYFDIRNLYTYIISLSIYSLVSIKMLSLLYIQQAEKSLIYPIHFEALGKLFNNLAYYDSGNNLTDPYNGNPSIIADYRIFKNKIPKSAYDCIKQYHKTGNFNYEEFSKNTGVSLYPIAFRTISSDFSTMPSFTVRSLIVSEKQIYKNITVCISRYEISQNGNYAVLLNNKLNPERKENSND